MDDAGDEVTVRFFAAARDAAGLGEVSLRAGDVAKLREALVAALPASFARVLAISTLLCDGMRLGEGDTVPAGATVDVLPPFAGG